VSARCEIEQGVLILRLAPAGFSRMADVVQEAVREAALRPSTRLLIDLRCALLGLNYEDMRSQIRRLAGAGAAVTPVWAVLTTGHAYGASSAGMFSLLAQIEDVTVQVFEEEEEALVWLQQWNQPQESAGG
jgi:hypothetical protein